MSKSTLLLYCSVAVFLAACGGRSDAPMPARAATTDVDPVAARNGSDGHTTYRSGLSAVSSEDEEPRDMSLLKLPQPEDAEPEPVK